MEANANTLLFGQYLITQLAFFLICLSLTVLITIFSAIVRCHGEDKMARRMVFVSFFMNLIQNAVAVTFARAEYPLITVHGYLVLQLIHTAHMCSMAYGRLRSPLWRIIITVPACVYSSACTWAVLILPGWIYGPKTWLWFIFPLALSVIGIFHSQTNSRGDSDIYLSDEPTKRLKMLSEGLPRGVQPRKTPLTFFQITDPHLGPFMSIARLRGICERAVAANPHLIFLTGDFFTLESHFEPDALAKALEPLKAYKGKVFACLGNHDYECRPKTEKELEAVGAQLLVNAETVVTTPAGKVQITSAAFTFNPNQKKDALIDLTRDYERMPGHLRILLLHDPLVFKHVPDGAADLVLSGHTHGGQVGVRTRWGTCSVFAIMTNICRIPLPGIGFWGNGSNRLYVHPGTGFYGFPLRVGIRGHEGVVRVHYSDNRVMAASETTRSSASISEEESATRSSN